MHTPKKLILGAAIAACFSSQPAWINPLWAAELNTKLPLSEEDALLSQKITINLPAQPLAASLKALSAKISLNITYNDKLVTDKQAPALSGTMRSKEALQKLLANTGLEAKLNDNTLYIQRLTKVEAKDIQLDKVEVRAKRFYEVGPLPGLGLTKEEIPGNVQSISAKEIKEAHSLSITDLMNRKLQSVTVNDYQGNPFQMDVQYRGFTASPQLGTPQGLSVFFDGIRVNEPFGDVVNWDMIPMNALANIDVFPGSNPIFGLGTLGGAFAIKTKDGFNNAGSDLTVLTGSFGRKQLQLEGGWNNGTLGLFAAGNFFLEDGWRENSPSRVNQLFTKASYRGDKLDLNFSTLLVQNKLVGNGLLPSEMYAQDRNSVFTSPDTTRNNLSQFQLSGAYQVNDTFSITGQVYRRNSKRKSIGADVYTDYEGTSNFVNRNLKPGEEFTCLFNSTNKYGLPDYYIVDLPNNDFFQNDFIADYLTTGVANLSLLPASAFNQDLPDDFAKHAVAEFNFYKGIISSIFYRPADNSSPSAEELPPFGDVTDYSNGEPSYLFNGLSVFSNFVFPGDSNPLNPLAGLGGFYFYTPDGTKHLFTPIKSFNAENCNTTQYDSTGNVGDVRYLNPADPASGNPQLVDGVGTTQPGVAEGTPTAVFNNNEINQITDGASLQLNWNLERHKLMVGVSVDRPTATYSNGQQLGLLTANRKAYLAPDEIRDQYSAADTEIFNNDFSGVSITKSIYASDTWTPVENVHITGSVRYNDNHVKNKLAQRLKGESFARLAYYQNIPNTYDVCVNGVCPTTGYRAPDLSNLIQKPETEQFNYYSLNPALGATWQVTEHLNIYSNWSQGVRTPSVIELGCAFDDTPVDVGAKTDANGNVIGRKYLERSLAEGRSCQLPSTLSGDPYLPQIKAQTVDFGLRGSVMNVLGAQSIEWNLGLYRTNLKDDIYMVTYPGNRNFFDTIGKTRRQGLEAGFNADFGKTKFKINYALTDATFQDDFYMVADDNSSAVRELVYCNSSGGCIYNDDTAGRINVKPGNRMPGVPLHNLNATLNYEVSPQWQIGLSAVAHSFSYLRGNENNQHEKGVARTESYRDPITGQLVSITRQPTNNPGAVPGYMTLNFQTSYQLNKEWTATLLVNNLLDKEYFSAGRLGRNPFSPSIFGAIGPDGYNHNSGDWLSTNFIAPGAPRGIWFSLNWHFVPD
ncbi:TonB-dependent receptor [Methylophilus sp.]|uniref:TonB-dependent receptor domain-containing protein n=1 Tax=Methylophilus sp. TaxID=29541 RepID=UPI000D3F9BD5|nr:TonB-dependent receptor [Methylophilus sp.]PPD13399.1 MAG: TonB-dependent receptor [Methylophilus sp.]